MTRRFYNLPSLTALTAFEAAARHRSLQRAAAELNVTPGAISRQVAALEAELGIEVFVRGRHGLTLAPAAEELYGVLSSAFSRTADAVQRVRARDARTRVTLACTHAFALLWLMPRMGAFWQDHPDITVDHLVSDNARDFRRSEVDLRIRYGDGDWPDETSHRLLEETIYPVCSPDFAARHAATPDENIADLPLLEVGWGDPDWADWDELLRRAGLPTGSTAGRRLSNYALAIEACQQGQGLAIGWHKLIAPRIAGGTLVPFGAVRMRAPGDYYICWNRNRTLSAAAETVRRWLQDAAAREAA